MCGRFTLMLDAEKLKSEFGLEAVPADLAPRFNIAPSQPVAVLTDWNKRVVEWMRWGLVPSWAKDVSISNKLINARGETLQEKPSFRNAFQRRRCLIFADGFYEWKREGGKTPSVPYYFYARDRKPFAFAGLWEFWRSPDGDDLRSCTIITTSANGLLSDVHERMPVILDRLSLPAWLGAGTPETWNALLKPYPAEEMLRHPVSRAVNSPGRDDPLLVQPQGA
jgi:putative SOS response-associated peptidase YedK